MTYGFTATIKYPGIAHTPAYSGTVEAASVQAAKVAAKLQTSAELNVPDSMIKKLSVKAVG